MLRQLQWYLGDRTFRDFVLQIEHDLVIVICQEGDRCTMLSSSTSTAYGSVSQLSIAPWQTYRFDGHMLR